VWKSREHIAHHCEDRLGRQALVRANRGGGCQGGEWRHRAFNPAVRDALHLSRRLLATYILRCKAFRVRGHRSASSWHRFDNRHNYLLSNFCNAHEDRSVDAPSGVLGKNMSRTINRLAIAAMATAGMFWPVFVLSATATADPAPSPGVPCLDMVQQFAAAPPSIPESLQTAAWALNTPVPEQAAPVPPAPAADVIAMAAPAQPAPIPEAAPAPPVAAPPVAAAPVAEAAGVDPPPAPPVPVAAAPLAGVVPPVPPVPAVAGIPPAPPLPIADVVQGASAMAAPAPPVAAAPVEEAAGVAPLPPPVEAAPPLPTAPVTDVVEAAPPPPVVAPPVAAPVESVPPPPTAPAAEAAARVAEAAAPVAEAAGVVPPPAPAVPVPAVPLADGLPPVPPVTVPVAPIAEAVPGLPLLPSSLPVPHDFVCEGTAWSAGRNTAGDAAPRRPLTADRRHEW
jgi:hypothetical protein